MRSIRLRAFGVLAVGLYLGLGLGSATAGDDTVKSKVKITEGGATHFEGTVTSKKSKCEKGRKVSLSYKDGGPYKRGEVIDSDRTDAEGNWELERLVPGRALLREGWGEAEGRPVLPRGQDRAAAVLADLH